MEVYRGMLGYPNREKSNGTVENEMEVGTIPWGIGRTSEPIQHCTCGFAFKV